MSTGDVILGLLTGPLDANWTVDALAERILRHIADEPKFEGQEFALAADDCTDRQSHRLLRPLLACLANKSAVESVAEAEIYRGRLSFQRMGRDGPVRITGEFDNRPNSARLILRRSRSGEPDHESATGRQPVIPVSANGASSTTTPAAQK